MRCVRPALRLCHLATGVFTQGGRALKFWWEGVKFNMTPNGERQKKWSSPFQASHQNFDAASSV